MAEETVNEQLGLDTYSENQKMRFAGLCKSIKEGKISANKAYEYAQMDGQVEDDKGFKGSFKEWMTISNNSGWLNPINDTNKMEVKTTEGVVENKTDIVRPILIGVCIVLAIVAITKLTKKNN